MSDPEPPDGAVYLVQSRLCRRDKRTKRDHWQPECAFRTAAEAEAYARANERHYFHGWRVTRVGAEGALAALLAARAS